MFGLQLGRLGISGLTSWSPTTLFAAGEKGGLWDFSTLTNLYQDSALTTPCTAVGDPIGLVLDTKNGTPQLGPERVTGDNATFTTGVGSWYANTSTIAAVGGEMQITQTGANGRAALHVAVTAGALCEISADVRSINGVDCCLMASRFEDGNGAFVISAPITSQTYQRVTLLAYPHTDAPGTLIIAVGVNGGGTGVYACDNISVREIPGNHLTQSTSTKRPVLGRMPAGGCRNILVNTATLSTQNVTTVAGNYTIQFTGAGSVTASGTYSGALTNGQTFTCTAGTLTLTVSGSVTNAQLEAGSTATAYQKVGAAYDVTESGVASVYTAYFDGVDDALVSPSIDFTATDAMSVFAGIRKTSDAARGMVAELSATTGGNNGVFALTAPNAASATIAFESKGSALTDAVGTSTAPANAVVSATAKISTDSNVLRINGSQADSDSGDQGTGSYGNYAIYFGQRGAASLPYKGFISFSCVRGAASSGAEVAAMESWARSKTPGVALP